jgi:uncharacterized protein (TIGR03083 family)
MRTRAEQVAGIKADQQFWRTLAAEVGPDRYDEPGAMGEWTFGDLAGHLLGWRNRTITRFEAIARGDPDPLPEDVEGEDVVHGMNDRIREAHAGRPAADLVADYDASYDRLIDALRALPDELFTDPDALEWVGAPLIEITFTGHLHEEHVPDVRAWLERG